MNVASCSSERRSTIGRPRAQTLALLAIVLLAWGLRLARIERQSLWWDESLSLYRAQRSVPFILSNHIDFPGMETTDQHPPLYFLVLHIFAKLAGERDLALRLPSALFSTLTVPLVYALARRLFDQRTALGATLLVALSPFHLWYAQEARMYTMVTALCTLSLYALWRALNARQWRWGAVAVGAMGAALATQYLAALLLPVQALLCAVWFLGNRATSRADKTRRRRVPKWRLRHGLVLASIVLVLALSLFLARDHIRTLLITLRAGRIYVPLHTILLDVLNSYSLGLSVSLRHVWPLDIAFFAIYVTGVIATFRSGRDRTMRLVLLVGAIVIPIALIWFFSLFLPVYMNSRYLMMVSPLFYLGIAAGVRAIASYRWPLALLAFVILVGGMAYSIQRYYDHDEYASKENYDGVAEKVLTHEQVGDLVVVNGAESLTAFQHYYRGHLPVISMPFAGSTPERIADDMSALANEYDRLFVVHGRRALTDPARLVLDWVERNTFTVMNVGFPSKGYYLRLSTDALAHPVQPAPSEAIVPIGVLDERLALLDYEVRYLAPDDSAHRITATVSDRVWESETGLTATAAVATGTNLSAHFRWEPRAELPALKMSLRLVDPDVIWAQRDREPYQYLSTTEWPVGSHVRQDALLPIPVGTPPGHYHLQLWVYEQAQGSPYSMCDSRTGWVQPYIELGSVDVASGDQTSVPSDFLPKQATYMDGATFGGSLDLLACDLVPDIAPDARSLLLTTYWHHTSRPLVNLIRGRAASSSVLDDYDLLVHLVSADGRIHPIGSKRPAGDAYPTTRWQEDELVRGICRLPIPSDVPPGRYDVHLLLRSRHTDRLLWVRRAPLLWSGHDVRITEIDLP